MMHRVLPILLGIALGLVFYIGVMGAIYFLAIAMGW